MKIYTTWYSARVIPFRVQFRPGVSRYEQVVYSAKRAIVSGNLRRGDSFPSVRALSRELKINPNIAQRIVAHLIESGLLEARPGVGTIVAMLPEASAKERAELLGREIEELVVEAKRLRLELQDIVSSVSDHWKRLEGSGKR